MATLQDNINTLKGIGEKRAFAFARLGVCTLYDLLSFFPRRYEDRSVIVPIAEAADGIPCCISAVVADEPRLSRIRRGMDLVKFRVFDSSGAADITYFNQNWMKNNICRGEEYIFYGKIETKGRRRSMANPVFEKAGAQGGVTGSIIPVYRLSRGLTQKNVLQSVKAGLEACSGQLPEPIPEDILTRLELADVKTAYENVHFPTDFRLLQGQERGWFLKSFSFSPAPCSAEGQIMRKRRGFGIKCRGWNASMTLCPFPPRVPSRGPSLMRWRI